MNTNSMDNSNNTDKIKDAYYKYLGECHVDNLVKELDDNTDEICKTAIPETLDKWFEEFLKETKKLDRRKKRIKFLKRLCYQAALIIIVLITALSILTFTVDAVKVKVLNFFIESHEKYSSYRVDETSEGNNSKISSEKFYYPLYLPKDYILEKNTSAGAITIVDFTNNSNGSITFIYAPNGTDYNLDTENAIITEVIINKNNGFLIEKENKIMLIWHDENNTYYLLSNDITVDIIKIAKSIEIK